MRVNVLVVLQYCKIQIEAYKLFLPQFNVPHKLLAAPELGYCPEAK